MEIVVGYIPPKQAEKPVEVVETKEVKKTTATKKDSKKGKV